MNPTIRLLATLAVSSTALAACGLGTVTPDELRDQLVDQGFTESYATCLVGDLEASLDDSEFQDVATADDLDGDLGARATEIVEDCALAEN